MKHIKPGAPQAIAHTQILPGVLPPEGAFTQQILEAAMSSTLVSGLKKRIWKEERRKASAGVVPSEITYFELIVSIPSFFRNPMVFRGMLWAYHFMHSFLDSLHRYAAHSQVCCESPCQRMVRNCAMRNSCEGPSAIHLSQEVGPKLGQDTGHGDVCKCVVEIFVTMS